MTEAKNNLENNQTEKTLWNAYRATVFEAETSMGRLALRVDQTHMELDRLLESEQKNTWCFITAWNPGSQPLNEDLNTRRNLVLENEIQKMGHPYFFGQGRGPDERWPAEHSFLVLGLSREESIAAGKRHEQNAVVYGELGSKAELMDTRKTPE